MARLRCNHHSKLALHVKTCLHFGVDVRSRSCVIIPIHFLFVMFFSFRISSEYLFFSFYLFCSAYIPIVFIFCVHQSSLTVKAMSRSLLNQSSTKKLITPTPFFVHLCLRKLGLSLIADACTEFELAPPPPPPPPPTNLRLLVRMRHHARCVQAVCVPLCLPLLPPPR